MRHRVQGMVTLATLLHDGRHLPSRDEAARRRKPLRRNPDVDDMAMEHLSELVEGYWGELGIDRNQSDEVIELLTGPPHQSVPHNKAVRIALRNGRLSNGVPVIRLFLRNANCPSAFLAPFADVKGDGNEPCWKDVVANPSLWMADLEQGGALGLKLLKTAHRSIMDHKIEIEMDVKRSHKIDLKDVAVKYVLTSVKMFSQGGSRKSPEEREAVILADDALRVAAEEAVAARMGIPLIRWVDWRPYIRLIAYRRDLFAPLAEKMRNVEDLP